jgi:hypothetical protein
MIFILLISSVYLRLLRKHTAVIRLERLDESRWKTADKKPVRTKTEPLTFKNTKARLVLERVDMTVIEMELLKARKRLSINLMRLCTDSA